MSKSHPKLEGEVFGELTVIGFAYKNSSGIWWNCSCSCGEPKIARTDKLRMKLTWHCGCKRTNEASHRARRSRTHCHKGHEYREGSFKIKKSNGARVCLLCRRRSQQVLRQLCQLDEFVPAEKPSKSELMKWHIVLTDNNLHMGRGSYNLTYTDKFEYINQKSIRRPVSF